MEKPDNIFKRNYRKVQSLNTLIVTNNIIHKYRHIKSWSMINTNRFPYGTIITQFHFQINTSLAKKGNQYDDSYKFYAL